MKRRFVEIAVKEPVPIYFKSLLTTAYKVYEEEKLHSIKNKEMNGHVSSMLNQCKKGNFSR